MTTTRSTIMDTIHIRNLEPGLNAAPYIDAPAARDYIVALGRVYLTAGLPLSAAFEAALADYHAFGAPFSCEG